jgi:predicted small lipoprotein YifL
MEETMKRNSSSLIKAPLKLSAMLAIAFMITLPGCEQEGPAEKAGEEIDEAVDRTADEIEEAADELEEGVQ